MFFHAGHALGRLAPPYRSKSPRANHGYPLGGSRRPKSVSLVADPRGCSSAIWLRASRRACGASGPWSAPARANGSSRSLSQRSARCQNRARARSVLPKQLSRIILRSSFSDRLAAVNLDSGRSQSNCDHAAPKRVIAGSPARSEARRAMRRRRAFADERLCAGVTPTSASVTAPPGPPQTSPHPRSVRVATTTGIRRASAADTPFHRGTREFPGPFPPNTSSAPPT